MSRSQIDRLTRRIEALQAQRKPPEQRVFTVLVTNHMRTDEEIARFCAEHGVTDSDLLIAQVLVPFETRPGETAKDAYERELRAMARNDDQGRKSQEASSCDWKTSRPALAINQTATPPAISGSKNA